MWSEAENPRNNPTQTRELTAPTANPNAAHHEAANKYLAPIAMASDMHPECPLIGAIAPAGPIRYPENSCFCRAAASSRPTALMIL